MSLTLLFICRRAINFSQLKSAFLYPSQLSSTIFINEFSTLKSKYSSLKPSSSGFQNPFREPTDDKSRRLKLQEQIHFREQYQLENDYELIYAMPRQRMYGLMHLLCTCATITMFTFIIIHFHREMLDMEPLINDVNQEIPSYVIYSIAAILGSCFATVLVFIARMPVRLYYSPIRHSYALFYHPIIGVFRQKKILFRNNQYKIIPQKLDNIEAPQRSIKIRIEFGQGLLKMKNSFYLIENLFRSKRDIQKVRMMNIDYDEKPKENQTEQETDIWETVVENKDQDKINLQSSKRKTFT